MTHITRDRTDSELIIVKKNFSTLVNILQKLEIDFMIDNGLLLGIVRDGDIIKWDWDIEFSFYDNVLINNMEKIIKETDKRGFSIHKVDKKLDKLELYKELPYEVFSFTFKGWKHNKKKNCFERKEFRIPDKYFLNLEKINYLNLKFNCPGPIVEYLDFLYGDWKTPKRSGNLQEYLTKNYYKKQNFIILNLKRLFYRVKYIYDKFI